MPTTADIRAKDNLPVPLKGQFVRARTNMFLMEQEKELPMIFPAGETMVCCDVVSVKPGVLKLTFFDGDVWSFLLIPEKSVQDKFTSSFLAPDEV